MTTNTTSPRSRVRILALIFVLLIYAVTSGRMQVTHAESHLSSGLSPTDEKTIRVSISSFGSQGNGASDASSPIVVSSDGRYVAFYSVATNLATGPSSYIHDLVTGQTQEVVKAYDGTPVNAVVIVKSFSMDGRYLLFDSNADNILPNVNNGWTQVYLLDRQSGQVTLISTDEQGKPRTGYSNGKLSGNGRYVVYGTNYYYSPSLILRDLQTAKETVVVPGDTQTIRHKFAEYAVSDDGRFVVFQGVSDLLPGGRDVSAGWNVFDVYIFDRQSNSTKRMSAPTNGDAPNDMSFTLAISGDGSVVVFDSQATNLGVCGEPCPVNILYAYETATGKLKPLVDDPNKRITNVVAPLSITRDGRLVAFIAAVDNLVPGDDNKCVLTPINWTRS